MTDSMEKPISMSPHSVEAEEAVLGAILTNDEAFYEIAAFLKPDDFFLVQHNFIWSAIVAVMERKQALDYITVVTELKNKGQLEEIGGPGRITFLINNTPTHLHAVTYARIVQVAAIRRSLLAGAAEVAKIALEEDAEISDVLDHAEQAIFSRTHQRTIRDDVSIKDAADSYFNAFGERMNGESGAIGLSTGIDGLDTIMPRRLWAGRLHVVAARPGMGKTSLLLQIALNVARQNGRVAIISLEMLAEELMDRLHKMETAIPYQKLDSATLDSQEFALFTQVNGDIGRLPIRISDSPSMTIQQIASYGRAKQRTVGLDLLIIDYLQLITADNRYKGNRNLEIGEITRKLKELAMELKIPILMACQLSREGDEGTPKLVHLRDSGEIEQNCDWVSFIFRHANQPDNRAMISVPKNRHGPKNPNGFVVGWNGPLTLFSNVSEATPAPIPF